jgi:hypothetical protein
MLAAVGSARAGLVRLPNSKSRIDGTTTGLATGGPTGRAGIKIEQDPGNQTATTTSCHVGPMGHVKRTVSGFNPLTMHTYLLCGGVAHTKAPS